MKRSLILFLTLGCIAWADPIKIGVLGDFSGPIYFWGQPYRDSAILAYEELGLKPDEVQLIYEDWGGDWSKIPMAVRKLIYVDHVEAIINTFDKATYIVAPVVRKAKIPQLSLALDDRPADGKTTFTVWTPVTKSVRLLLEEADKRGYKHLTLLVLKDYYPYRTELEIQKQVKDFPGMTIAYVDHFDPSLRDFRTFILKARQTSNDLTVVIAYPPTVNVLTRQLIEEKVWPITSVEGFDQLEADVAMLPEGTWWAGSAENSPAFNKSFKKRFGYDTFTGPTYSYDCVKLLVEALRRNRQNPAEALVHSSVEGAAGRTTILPSGAGDMKACLKERKEGKTVVIEER